jgi:NADPH-dependent glutamate synthase beta subunit-like oxidoreductase
MALLKKNDSVKPLRVRSSVSPGAGASAVRPHPVRKASPCATACLAGTDVRGVVSLLAQYKKLGLSQDQACEQAWRLLVETNPFPAITGRICPHRCEEGCNRHSKDGGVAVGDIERYIGDWAIERGLKLPSCAPEHRHGEKIAIIGAGPAGLSCAYQLARRGWAPALFESMPEPGGMLRYGIPPYRLPAGVLKGEIQRILDLGVELRTNTMIGRDVTLDELRQKHRGVFIAPGAGASRAIEIPGSEGTGVYQAIGFLRDVARGQPPQTGKHVVVLGGGNTAIDVARVCIRLLGPDAIVTLIRRRNELIDAELQDAIAEGVHVELRTTLNEIIRDATEKVIRVVAQRVGMGEKDERGYRKMIPIPGANFELAADSVVLALGQKPDIKSLGPSHGMNLEADATGKTQTAGIWRGGDAVAPSFAALVIAQGRQVALSIDTDLRAASLLPPSSSLREVDPKRLKLDFYEPRPRLERQVAPPEVRVADMQVEVELGHNAEEAFNEASRCLSCGSCFGCERCWMFCTPGCMKRLPVASPGNYFSIQLEKCDGCNKCVDECPCGFLEMS